VKSMVGKAAIQIGMLDEPRVPQAVCKPYGS
jgi:hypothetical protein